jgi:hypothetical protein
VSFPLAGNHSEATGRIPIDQGRKKSDAGRSGMTNIAKNFDFACQNEDILNK